MSDAISSAEFQLRRLIVEGNSEFVSQQIWFYENDRFNELLFSFLAAISGQPQDDLRALVETLDELQLLDVKELAAIRGDSAEPDVTSAHACRLIAVMEDYGISNSNAVEATKAFAETAWSVEKHFGGRLQRYLRSYAERMLKELGEHLEYSSTRQQVVQNAFSLWLQNGLSMPISMRDSHLQEFSGEFDLEVDDLLKAADNLNINFLYLDDLIQVVTNLKRSLMVAETRNPDSQGAIDGGK